MKDKFNEIVRESKTLIRISFHRNDNFFFFFLKKKKHRNDNFFKKVTKVQANFEFSSF